MPLIVPVLRLAMLFLNIYDSYKTLKPPPPSSRHAGRPSLRALTQRKRNMKGCLAVWIVWCCFTLYERMVEGLISLFIPFYEEIKSLVIVFLILTRARGAEPIYLHMIRPFLKPYTTTLDSLLDFMFLICDIVLAAMHVPINPVLSLWRRWFGHTDVPLEQVSTSPAGESYPVDSEGLHTEQSNGHVPSGSRRPDQTSGANNTHPRVVSKSHIPKLNGRQLSQSGQNGDGVATRKHEIWYPPLSAYMEDEQCNGDIRPRAHRSSTSSSIDSDTTLAHSEQVDEWRQYPQFPAAYPPTPLVTLTRLTSQPTSLEVHAEIEVDAVSLQVIDEMPKQDFRRSLSPPRETKDPNSDGDVSDSSVRAGFHNFTGDDDDDMTMAVDVDNDAAYSTLDEEEEDEFNMTLQTPLPAQVFSKTYLHASRMSRTTSLATTASARSRSTALSTVDNGSSLRTRSSLDSLSSSMFSEGESPTVSKKRPLPISRNASTGEAERREENSDVPSRPQSELKSAKLRLPAGTRKPKLHASINRTRASGNDKTKLPGGGDVNDAPDMKKRKIASPNKVVVRTVKPVRPRLQRPVSPPARQRNMISHKGQTTTRTRSHTEAASHASRTTLRSRDKLGAAKTNELASAGQTAQAAERRAGGSS
ncbi:hypothetical protein AX17_002071 [Amanita inopinata Kibby_2008]|nr:hypothetical protein AX17_002071 [Amanita inopinata Kibby_2008]